MKQEHLFELETSGLDEFMEKLKEELSTENQTIEETFEKFVKGIDEVLNGGAAVDVAAQLQKILDLFMGDVKVDARKLIAGEAFAKGGKTKGGTTLVGEKGRELVVDPDGHYMIVDEPQLLNLPKDSLVYDNKETEQMLKKSRTSDYYKAIGSSLISSSNLQTSQLLGSGFTQMASLLNGKAMSSNISPLGSNITIQNNYGSLLNVDGNVDSTVVSDLQDLLEDAYRYTEQRIFQQLTKVGHHITLK